LTASLSGFVNGETPAVVAGSPALATSANGSSHVGVYPIAVGPGSLAAANYEFVFVAGVLSVTPAPLTIMADSRTWPMGQPAPALTASYIGFVNGDTPASLAVPPILSTPATAASLPGDYPIALGGAASSDYAIAFRPGVMTVIGPPPSVAVSIESLTLKVGRKKTPALVVAFSHDLDLPDAQKLANYRLATPGRDKRYGTKDDVVTRLASVSYDASTRTVTLKPKGRFGSGRGLRLTIANLRDRLGRPVDGDRDGTPGGEVALAVPKKGVAPAARAGSAPFALR
jgi:hypothetical protein